MIKGVIIKKLTKNYDQRGWLSEIYRLDELPYQPVMSYVSVTKPDAVRGPHEHRKQTDFFIFLGPGNFKLYLWDNRKKSKTYQKKLILLVGEKNPTAVLVPPGIVHGYKCLAKKPSWVINLPNELYRGKNKKQTVDEIRWEINPNSLFLIK